MIQFWIEKIGSSCSNNLCGAGKCFPVNDPFLPYVCLCPNAQFAASCPGTEMRLTTARMLVTTTAAARSTKECDPLERDSCMNGGQCLPMMKTYQCLCTSGFTGRFCEISKFRNSSIVFRWIFCYLDVNSCIPNPCE